MEDILSKIAKARATYLNLDLDPSLKEASSILLQALQRCREISREIGLSEICRICDTEGGGSCCGRGIENYYDEPLLLLNCILGANLHQRRGKKDSCFFLGPNGCVLVARHTLCVNYMCEKILGTYGPRQLQELREAEGIALELTFWLCERLRGYLHEQTVTKHIAGSGQLLR